jgi:hypothetical protein
MEGRPPAPILSLLHVKKIDLTLVHFWLILLPFQYNM